jgi:hypothetical protein
VPVPVNAAVQERMRDITRRSLTPGSLKPADLLVS